MTALASLLLADSRLPTGGHAHSGAVEAAVEHCLVRNEADLELFLAGRLRGSGSVVAAVAAAGCLLAGVAAVKWDEWDAALSARTPSAAARPADHVARAAVSGARDAVAQQDPRLLPSTGTPLPEVLAELHARAEVTLFAS